MVKIAVKTGAILVIMAAIVLLLVGVPFPTIDVGPLIMAVGKGKAIVDYYMGDFSILLEIWMWLLTLRYIGLPAYYLAVSAIKWVIKVNE